MKPLVDSIKRVNRVDLAPRNIGIKKKSLDMGRCDPDCRESDAVVSINGNPPRRRDNATQGHREKSAVTVPVR